ncbi:DUF6078 family protein [Porphyromonas gingivalis]|uniref:DUF6078 family protein n=1 Tax=Porphyromonas gingivalis TaxID=837 RepID=UPI000B4E0F98|nr:DUF6078 family protein [Porphyromonas gingivalis]OWR77998.1 hypothetical protein SJDPG4_06160 [Porphyromonas gingivalis SJD4]
MQKNSCYTPLCPRRETCLLWFNALECIDKGATQISITNPKIIQEAGGYDHCPLYYKYKLRQFARGLIWTYQELTVAQQQQIHEALNTHFGYSSMVRMRCGYEAIDPDEQATIASIFEAVAPGVIKPRYRSFEEHYIKPPRVEGRAARKLIR